MSEGSDNRASPAGVYPMLYTFFDAAGRIDTGPIAAQVAAMRGAGVHGIAILGLAGETNKLTGANATWS